jgi:uncharacterized protein YxjI
VIDGGTLRPVESWVRDRPALYLLGERLMSIGDDYWIEDCWIEGGEGERVYRLEGRDLRRRSTLILENREGRELASITRRVRWGTGSVEIRDGDAHRIATVSRALVDRLRQRRWGVRIDGGAHLDIRGDVQQHEYTFLDGRTPVATVSKGWFEIAETYGVEVAPEQDPVLVLAAAVAVDLLVAGGR